MSNPILPKKLCIEAVRAVEQHESLSAAAEALGIPDSTLYGRLRTAKFHYKLVPDKKKSVKRRGPGPRLPRELAEESVSLLNRYGDANDAARAAGINPKTFKNRLVTAEVKFGLLSNDAKVVTPESATINTILLRKMLQQGPATLDDVCQRFGVTVDAALDAVEALRHAGQNVYRVEGRFSIEKTPVPVERSDLHIFKGAPDERYAYRFGFVTDNHLGSKYAREDVLNQLYDWFVEEGITRVYNAGNWIDGEAPFNKFDIHTHGMTAQVRYFATHYPQRKDITTLYVAGDDHEGWYAQRNGVDIGRYAQQEAESLGRNDLKYLGYIEAYITLLHPSGKSSQMLVMHPGGGSAYAVSYSAQKIVESFEGGEKPAVLLLGHYHKLEMHNDRNVWVFQGGTTCDQTTFMRKKKLQAHIGGWVIEMRQDEHGAIPRVRSECWRFFDRGYYNNSFNLAGPIRKR
jgi:hypothetical protein